jgi:hypothetical protein
MSKGLTETKCPFHAHAKRSDIVAKLLEEDYYYPLSMGYYGEDDPTDIGKREELIAWYNTLSNTELLDILYTDEHYGICWCENE